jgi:hypothetical protein
MRYREVKRVLSDETISLARPNCPLLNWLHSPGMAGWKIGKSIPGVKQFVTSEKCPILYVH